MSPAPRRRSSAASFSPVAAAWPRLPRIDARITRRPSGAATEPRMQDLVLVHRRECAERHLAAAAKRLDYCALRDERGHRVGVGDGGDRACHRVGRSVRNLDCDDALTWRRVRRRRPASRAEMRPASPSRISPAAASTSDVALAGFELAQPRVDVAADGDERRAREEARELGRSPDAARADARRPDRAPRRLASIPLRARRRQGGRAHRADPPASSAAAMRSPSGSAAGRSLLLCTATIDAGVEKCVFDLLYEQPLDVDGTDGANVPIVPGVLVPRVVRVSRCLECSDAASRADRVIRRRTCG